MRKDDKMFYEGKSRPWQARWWKEDKDRGRWVGTAAVVLLLLGIFAYQNPQVWQGQQADLTDPADNSLVAELDPPPGVLDIVQEIPEPGELEPPTTADAAADNGAPQEADTPAGAPEDVAEDARTEHEPLEEVVSVSAAPTSWQAPASGEWVRAYGYAQDPTLGDYRHHSGVDLAVTAGTLVFAAADGIVVEAKEDPYWGGIVVIEHGGSWQTSYRCLKPSVKVNAEISMGEQIGSVLESTKAEAAQEPHLHFEMALAGQSQDPAEWL